MREGWDSIRGHDASVDGAGEVHAKERGLAVNGCGLGTIAAWGGGAVRPQRGDEDGKGGGESC